MEFQGADGVLYDFETTFSRQKVNGEMDRARERRARAEAGHRSNRARSLRAGQPTNCIPFPLLTLSGYFQIFMYEYIYENSVDERNSPPSSDCEGKTLR